VVQLRRATKSPTAAQSRAAVEGKLADDDFAKLNKDLPVFYANYADIGHAATYWNDNGGEFARVAKGWLRWQLSGDTSAEAKGLFVGHPCGLSNTEWVFEKRNLD
jgi:hypothetical protein